MHVHVYYKLYDIADFAATNNQVDKWNEIVQSRFENPSSSVQTLVSDDKLSEADDPHGFLKKMLNETVLNNFNKNGIPPHELKLRVGDVCLLQRT